MNKNEITISIIVPIYNEQDTILEILLKLNKLKAFCKIEIIIINDGSTIDLKKL